MTELGYIAAIIAAATWGTTFVPLKLLKRPSMLQYHVWMSIGIVLGSAAIAFLFNVGFSLNVVAVATGVLWGVGNVLNIEALARVGLARGTSIILGIAILLSFLWGTWFFAESVTLYMATAGVVLLLVGIPLVSSDRGGTLDKKGLLACIGSGIIFGSIFVPLKFSGLTATGFVFPMALGIFLSGLIVWITMLRKVSRAEITNGSASGIIWSVGNFSALNAVGIIGLAVGFPLTQLALLFSVGWGLFYFKEIQGKNRIIRIVIGAAILLIGAFLLAFSKL